MKQTHVLMVGLLIVAILLTGCSRGVNDGTIRVVTTIGMIADIARNLAGEFVEVTALMGPGVDPHLYKATASDVKRLDEAALILYGGLHLEGKMADVFETLSEMKPTVAVSEAIPKEYLLGGDPHVWFDISLWLYAVEATYEALIALVPEHTEAISQNHDRYVKTLQDLDAYVKEKAMSLDEEQRVLITAHDAFEYFGRAYGFEVKGLQGISTVSEAGTRNVQELAQYIVEHQIRAIFIESSVPQRIVHSMQQAVKARGFDVAIGGELFSDAMGDAGTHEGTFQGMVEHNINTIVGALALK
ncbi:MAG: zinc ABC transporter substrate-binding protein [Sphaerochaeta sp.]|jgi:manganese/zinc/iron transport system substrate-binding protein|nr:zinc ABC transporter solute-binding protein [Spirochaetales bacterium]